MARLPPPYLVWRRHWRCGSRGLGCSLLRTDRLQRVGCGPLPACRTLPLRAKPGLGLGSPCRPMIPPGALRKRECWLYVSACSFPFQDVSFWNGDVPHGMMLLIPGSCSPADSPWITPRRSVVSFISFEHQRAHHLCGFCGHGTQQENLRIGLIGPILVTWVLREI